MKKKLTLNTLKKLVEQKYSLTKALKEYNPQENYQTGRNCFCPFHHNENTPAASILAGKEGQPDILYCHAEQKRYTVADVVSKLMGYNIYEVGYLLWNDMTEHERETFLASIGEVDYNTIFGGQEAHSKSVSVNKSRLLYKENKITLNELLKEYLRKLGEVK